MIVLDTPILLWWLSGQDHLLSGPAKHLVQTAHKEKKIAVSSISSWEIAMLVARNRLALSMDVATWLSKAEETGTIEFIPVDNEIAIKSVELPEPFHKDPADRIIVATARKLAAILITADEKIQAYPHVKWVG